MAPKITVCIPTYNRASLLRLCLGSILRQTLADFEVLVSDNCSMDDPRSVVAEFHDSRVHYSRNERNIGPVPNINQMISQARGEYVAVVHDDDVYDPSFLDRESRLLDASPSVGMVHCAAYEVDSEGRKRRLVRAYRKTCIRDGRKEFLRFLRGHNVCCSTVMVRRRLYQSLGVFDPRYLCNDFHMWLRLALHADVGYVAEPLVEMRVHQNTVTNWLEPERWYAEFMDIVDEAMTLADRVQPDLALKRRSLLRSAAYAQGRRFFIAALAATARGQFELAEGYVDVLKKLNPVGLPSVFPGLARLTLNGVGKSLLTVAARVHRVRARRQLP
jgi:glycosyltransferase involved in cell wall biosynthesis